MLTAHLHEITAGLEASLNNATLAQTITASLSASEVSSLLADRFGFASPTDTMLPTRPSPPHVHLSIVYVGCAWRLLLTFCTCCLSHPAPTCALQRSAYFTSMAMLQTTIEKEKVTIKSVDQFWTLLAAFLVFFSK